MRPKLSTVIALLAVIVLTSVGTATAAGVINGKNIKKNSIPLSALNKNAIAALKGAQGPAGPAGAAGAAGAAAAKYFGQVDSAGAILAGSGVVQVVSNSWSGSWYSYDVKFAGSVSNCALVVTPGGGTTSEPNRLIAHFAVAGKSGRGAEWGFVQIYNVDSDTSGQGSGGTVRDSFSIAALC